MQKWVAVLVIVWVLVPPVSYAQEFELKRPDLPDDATPQIVGGQKANPYNWPATFLFTSINGSKCTATAVGPRVLLTAAHCIDQGPKGRIEGGNVSLVCSAHGYYGGASAHDIALCYASGDIKLARNAPYESLDPGDSGPAGGSALGLLGYGCTENDEDGGILYEGTASVSKAAIPSQPYFETGRGAAVCFGDSGGAAYQRRIAGSRAIVGVASKAIGSRGSRFSLIASAASRDFIVRWAKQQVDPATGALTEVKICGIDTTLHNCNR